MKIILFGTGEFAVPTLNAMSPHISLVVTQPDRPSGRHMRLQPSPIKIAAANLELPVEAPERSRSPEFVARLESEAADFLLVASYGQILSESVLKSAKHGGINLHGSILPRYRGAAPIQRSIENGDTETGVTLMQMDRGMDTGDIIEIVRTPIGSDETYGELQGRLSEIAADLALEWANRISEGDYSRESQDSSSATKAPKITRAETEIELTRSARTEYNRFRAFTPSPAAFLVSRFGRIKLLQLRFVELSGTPGEVHALNPELIVSCGEGGLVFGEVQPEGKRPMDGRAWANGVRLRIGDNLLA